MAPHSAIAPQLYGLPKVHKEGTPLRPIVFTIGSPTYGLAKELSRILCPLAGHTSSFVKNSNHFVQKIQDIPLDELDMMVSFDVCSLFTQVPIDKAMDPISEMLERMNQLKKERRCHPIKYAD